MYNIMDRVNFPKPKDRKVNMMPIVFGYWNTVPQEFIGYIPLMKKCTRFRSGSICYLTVDECFVPKGDTQRRGGIHVEAPYNASWGGGAWGGTDQGIYMASTDGLCEVWDSIIEERDEHGGVQMDHKGAEMAANTLYWMTDKTPHRALESDYDHYRQFFRLVSEDISVWYNEHNTKNPLGVDPSCEITYKNKFEL